jgi:hypothetical protein
MISLAQAGKSKDSSFERQQPHAPSAISDLSAGLGRQCGASRFIAKLEGAALAPQPLTGHN